MSTHVISSMYTILYCGCISSGSFLFVKESVYGIPVDKRLMREHSGSVVECLTRDGRAAGLGLTGVSVLCP